MPDASTTPLLVNLAALLALLSYLALVLHAGVRAARRERWRALWPLALVGLALLARALSSPRLPMGAANGDLTHLAHVARWMKEGLQADTGLGYPPSYRLLLYLLSTLAGPSLSLSFWLTTLASSLTALPAFALARRLTGSARAGAVAGLAAALYPPAVFFGNGVNLATPAALLLTASFVHLYEVLDRDSWSARFRYALSLALLIECRTEALAIVALVLVGHLGVAWQHGRTRRLLAAWPAGLVAVLAVAPFLWGLLGSEAAGRGGDQVADVILRGLVALVLVGALLPSLERWTRTRPWARLTAAGALCVTTLAVLAIAVRDFTALGGSWLAPRAFAVDELPATAFRIHPAEGGFALTQPGVVPVALLVLWLLSLLPSPAPRADDSAGGADEPDQGARQWPVAAPLLVLLPFLGYHLTLFIKTGVAVAEGLRLHVLFAGIVAAAIGLGAARLAGWLRCGLSAAGERLGWALAVALVGATAWTHADFMGDTLHNPQREYASARAAFAALPPRATLLLPDDLVDLSADRLGRASPAGVFRARHLIEALAWEAGSEVRVSGIGAAVREGCPEEPAVFAWLGLPCYRVPRGQALAPSCAAVRALGIEPVHRARFANRAYSTQSMRTIGIRAPEIELSLVGLSAEDIARAGERLR
jgi:hypothetical protein